MLDEVVHRAFPHPHYGSVHVHDTIGQIVSRPRRIISILAMPPLSYRVRFGHVDDVTCHSAPTARTWNRVLARHYLKFRVVGEYSSTKPIIRDEYAWLYCKAILQSKLRYRKWHVSFSRETRAGPRSRDFARKSTQIVSPYDRYVHRN